MVSEGTAWASLRGGLEGKRALGEMFCEENAEMNAFSEEMAVFRACTLDADVVGVVMDLPSFSNLPSSDSEIFDRLPRAKLLDGEAGGVNTGVGIGGSGIFPIRLSGLLNGWTTVISTSCK